MSRDACIVSACKMLETRCGVSWSKVVVHVWWWICIAALPETWMRIPLESVCRSRGSGDGLGWVSVCGIAGESSDSGFADGVACSVIEREFDGRDSMDVQDLQCGN